MKELIQKLSNMRAISGSEYRINKEIADMFLQFADEVIIDALGNVVAKKKSKNPSAPSIMIEAHCDEIGLMVTDITDDGFITFVNVGGIDRRILPSSVVRIHGRNDICGVIGIKSGAYLEKDKAVKITDMAIDTGLSKAALNEIVSIGDTITLPQSVGLLGDNEFSGKTLDDRASVAALIKVMENIKGEDLNVNVYACAHVQEEVGLRGAKVSAFNLNPDMAIAIDVTHGITPDNSYNAFKVGEGITISVGPNIHPALAKRIMKVSDDNDIKYSVEVDGGETGTDAWAIQNARNGIPTALLSIPLKYMHTSVETLSLDDVDGLVNLLTQFIKSQEGDTSWLTF